MYFGRKLVHGIVFMTRHFLFALVRYKVDNIPFQERYRKNVLLFRKRKRERKKFIIDVYRTKWTLSIRCEMKAETNIFDRKTLHFR